jgi:hypothetical protein
MLIWLNCSTVSSLPRRSWLIRHQAFHILKVFQEPVRLSVLQGLELEGKHV